MMVDHHAKTGFLNRLDGVLDARDAELLSRYISFAR